MGIAIRTGSPLSLSLAEGVWRQLAGQPLRPQDLAEVDKDFLPALLCIRDMTPHNKVHTTYITCHIIYLNPTSVIFIDLNLCCEVKCWLHVHFVLKSLLILPLLGNFCSLPRHI